MSTSVALPITWADIQSMPRGDRRAQLERAYRARRRAIHATVALANRDADQIRIAAEVHRIRALDRHRDTAAEQAARLAAVNADAVQWDDYRHPRKGAA